MKKIFIYMLVVILSFNAISSRKVKAVAIATSTVAWDIIGTLLFCAIGYDVYEVLTNDDTHKVHAEDWIADGQLTQEKIDFVKRHTSTANYSMTDEKAKEFMTHINQKEFNELKKLYNGKNNPDHNDGQQNKICNLSLFKQAYEDLKYIYDRNSSITDSMIGATTLMVGKSNYNDFYLFRQSLDAECRYGVVATINEQGKMSLSAYRTQRPWEKAGYTEQTFYLTGQFVSSYVYGLANVDITYMDEAVKIFDNEESCIQYVSYQDYDNNNDVTEEHKPIFEGSNRVRQNIVIDKPTVIPSHVVDTDTLLNDLTENKTKTNIETKLKTYVGEEIDKQDIPKTDTEQDEEELEKQLNVDNYKINGGIVEKFPFCIPFDLVRAFKTMNVQSETPYIEFPIKIARLGIDEVIVLDFNIFDDFVVIFRWFVIIGYIVLLIYKSRGLIKG